MPSLIKMEDDDVVQYVRGKVKNFDGWASTWRDEMRDAFEFAAGRQWAADDLAYLKEQNRPVVTFNRVAKFIAAIAGTEVNNKMEWKFGVGGTEDAASVDVTTKVVRQLTLDDEEGETTASFRDCLTCGYGWTDTKIDYTYSREGVITEEHVDPGAVGWDTRARKRNLSDARWVYRIKRYDEDELDEIWPGASDKVATGGMPLHGDAEGVGHLMDDGEYDFDNADDEGDDVPPDSHRGKYTVICFQQLVVKDMVSILNPLTGQVETVPASLLPELKKRLGKLGRGIKTQAKEQKRVWHHAYVCGTTLLAEVEELPCRSLEVITGKYDRNRKYCYGIVRDARDPQQWENKFRSTIMHNFSSAGKGIMVEEDAIPINEWRNFEKDWSRPDKIKKVAAGAISQGKIKAPDPIPQPPGLADLMVSAGAAVPDVLGISPEFLGLAGRTQSGVVEKSRRQAGLAVISEFFQARREHIKRTGRVKLAYVLSFMPDSVFVRIAGEEALAVLPQLRQADFARYDITVDEAPVSPDQRGEVWSDILSVAPALIPLGLPQEFWIEALRYNAAWPSSLVDKLEKALSAPNPQAEKQAQIAEADAVTKIEETKSKVALNLAKAKSEGEPDMSNVITAHAQGQKAQQDAIFKQQEHAMKMQQLGAQTEAKAINLGTEVVAKREQADASTMTAVIKGLVDIQKAKAKAAEQARGNNATGH